MVRGVHDPVDEIDGGVGSPSEQSLVKGITVGVSMVLDLDAGLRRDQSEAQLGENAEGAVRAVNHAEEQRLTLGRAREDLTRAGHDLVAEAGVVEAAVAERGRLDRTSDDGAAHRDALELGHDRGREPVRQRRVQQIGERDTRLGDASPALDVHLEDMAQRRDVDAAAREAPVAGRQRDDVVHATLVDVRGGPRIREVAHLRDDDVHPAVVIGSRTLVHGEARQASPGTTDRSTRWAG